jgi:succinoglycan biosynthesis protein ExoO
MEAELLAHADTVLAIHDRDAGTLRRMVGDRPAVRTVPHVAADEPVRYRPSTGAELMFVGCRHAGNRGIVDFVAHSWPAIRAAHPEATLHVYGEVRDWLEPVPGCRLAGVVDDRALAAGYARAAAVLAPIEVGSGLKIKVVEALHHGRAVVATPFAVRGMPAPRSEPWVLADGWPAFTRATLGLLADVPRRHRMERAGRRYAHDEYGGQRVDAALTEVLAGRPAPMEVA